MEGLLCIAVDRTAPAHLDSGEYEASGFVGAGTDRIETRNLMFDLAYRPLRAAGIASGENPLEAAPSQSRRLLDDVKIFRSLGAAETDRLSQQLVAQPFSAGQVVLEFGAATDNLWVIGTGVVSASIADGAGFVEAGRMGPGEVMGEEGVTLGAPSQARFTALTSSVIYRIDKDMIQACLDERTEVGSALAKLQKFREQASASLLVHKPVAIKKGGFLSWLRHS